MQSTPSREGDANPLSWRRAVPFQPDADCSERHLRVQFQERSSRGNPPAVHNGEPEEIVYQGAVDASCEDSVLINAETGSVLLAKNFFSRTYRQVTVDSFTELLSIFHPTTQVLTRCLHCPVWHYCICFAYEKIICMQRLWSRGRRAGPPSQSIRKRRCISCKRGHTCRQTGKSQVCIASTFRLRRLALPRHKDPRYLLSKKQQLEEEIRYLQTFKVTKK